MGAGSNYTSGIQQGLASSSAVDIIGKINPATGDSANITLCTEDVTGVGNLSGDILIKTGNIEPGEPFDNIGQINFKTGDNDGSGFGMGGISFDCNNIEYFDTPIGFQFSMLRGLEDLFGPRGTGIRSNFIPFGIKGANAFANGDDAVEIWIQSGGTRPGGGGLGGIELFTGNGLSGTVGTGNIDIKPGIPSVGGAPDDTDSSRGKIRFFYDEFFELQLGVFSGGGFIPSGDTGIGFFTPSSENFFIRVGDGSGIGNKHIDMQAGSAGTPGSTAGNIFVKAGDVVDNADTPGDIELDPGTRPNLTKGFIQMRGLINHNQKTSSQVVWEGGVTASRPGSPVNRQRFYDDTLMKPIWYDAGGAVWRDATGAAV
jgi:hypothetical protein